MLKITGYSDEISVRPGGTVRFYVNCEHPSYKAELVRIVQGDINPAGPGLIEPVIESPINRVYAGRPQGIEMGSFIWVADDSMPHALTSFSLQAMIWPTTPMKGGQGLITKLDASTRSGFALIIDEQGAAALRIGDGERVVTVSAGKAMLAREWYFVAASFDGATGRVRIYQEPRHPYPTIDDRAVIDTVIGVRPKPNDAPLMIAGWHESASTLRRIRAGGLYNGKIDAPRLTRRVLERAEMEALIALPVPLTLARDVVAAWDFAADITATIARDVSGNRLDGVCVNLPLRGVTGWNWTGDEMCWRHAPSHYGAIHFHDDDLYDACWDVDFTLTVPDDLKSGVYAAKLSAGEDVEYIPFVVRPKGGAEQKIAWLFPSASYMAYGNEHFATNVWLIEPLIGRATELFPHAVFLNEHREYGHSLYDYHADGTGVATSSRLRPLLNMRPRVQSVNGGAGSQIWQFNADTHILHWLERLNYDYDVITDEDLHQEGLDALRPYDVLLTGTHPEYLSKSMYDAIEAFTQTGGRLMYLGGNGFYWRIAYHQTLPGVIEVRRPEGGSRAWEPLNGEAYMGFTGEYGGLWRRQARTGPNVITGVGFASHGLELSSPYRRQPDSFNPRASWIFDGLGKDEVIGDFGFIGGGAAGLEIDRVDRYYGSPPHTLTLASSENHSDTYVLVVEDIFFNYPGTTGPENAAIRADLAFFETLNGGAVFSTGSIAWAGSMIWNECDNNVSRITRNVLDRFLDRRPFVAE